MNIKELNVGDILTNSAPIHFDAKETNPIYLKDVYTWEVLEIRKYNIKLKVLTLSGTYEYFNTIGELQIHDGSPALNYEFIDKYFSSVKPEPPLKNYNRLRFL